MKEYEFQLTEEQIQKAVKKYGIGYVNDVYRKLLKLNYTKPVKDTSESTKEDIRFNLGNGGFRYKKLTPKGEF